EADSDLVCQPGARWMDINETLKEKGMWPVSPPLQTRRLSSTITRLSLCRHPSILPCEPSLSHPSILFF
ncbi:hypothetical protein BDZ97DRAFT_1833403, partial [Flammula alnicola]